ncbi:MAG: hypothetical protein JNG86_21235 [Verrucomicrobiaceae bacterium]|nr:hypothetical protein [Verrucomicrobiaceae bacterium]
MKPTPILVLLAGLAAVSSVEAKWQRVPLAETRPVSMTAGSLQSGASIESSNGIGQVQSLLSSDVTKHADVAAGNSSAVVKFAKLVMVNKSLFISDGIEGRATLSGSADNKSWAVLDEKVFTSSDREVAFSFAGIQVKYVKLDFALSKGGSIRAFQIFGSEKDEDYTVKQSKDGKQGQPTNFATTGSRVIYAAPKPEGDNESAATFNKFAFPESDERYRTIIYDLGQIRMMNEFGSVHSPRPVRFEVFAFENLPEKEDWRGRLAFDPAEFNVKEPVASAEDTRGLGYIKAKPEKTVSSRFVALRWEPDFNPPSFYVFASTAVGFAISTYTPNAGGFFANLTADQKAQLRALYDDLDDKEKDWVKDVFQGAASLNGVGLGTNASPTP